MYEAVLESTPEMSASELDAFLREHRTLLTAEELELLRSIDIDLNNNGENGNGTASNSV